MFSRVIIISVNDTRKPRTGGEYTYKVMKDELTRIGYKVIELSVPTLKSEFLKGSESVEKSNIYEILTRLNCFFASIREYARAQQLIITSANPAFPVYGHIVYHQPKVGILTNFSKHSLSFEKKLGLFVIENEKLSPIWHFAKKSHRLHLSNSKFTERIGKKLYKVDSQVIYPPVPIRNFAHNYSHTKRTHSILVAKSQAVAGINLLPKIVERLPKSIKFVIIGNTDSAGVQVLGNLKRLGANIEYLGYVSEEVKLKLFRECSLYLHLGVNEPFGIVIIEAMANGCIPIAHRSGGVPEYLPIELLYSSLDEAADKLIEYIDCNDFELRGKLRNIALGFKEENFRRKFIMFVRYLERQMGA